MPFESLGAVSYSPSIPRHFYTFSASVARVWRYRNLFITIIITIIVTVAVFVAVCELFSVKACDLGNCARRRSRSLKMAPFNTPYATFYWSAVVTIVLSCTIFEFFDVE